MGNQLSQCGNAQACFDVNDTRLELTDSGDRPEEQPRPAYAQGNAATSPRDPMLDGKGGGYTSPRGPVGRNHSVQRSFGGSSPNRGRQVASEPDRMLEELRHMYGTRQPADAASLAEMIVRERERERAKDLAGSVKGAGRASSRGMRELEHEEDALVRSALDVVAQRYVNGGVESGSSGVKGALSSPHPASTPSRNWGQLRVDQQGAFRLPEDVGPQTHFSRRKKNAHVSPRAVGHITSGGGRTPTGGGAFRSRGDMEGRGEVRGGEGDWSHGSEDQEDEDEESGTGESADEYRLSSSSHYRRVGTPPPPVRPPRPPSAAGGSDTAAGKARRAKGSGDPSADRCTMEEVLRDKYGITLEDMAACGCAPPPPQLLRLRMTEADWAKHLRRAGVDVYIQRTPRQGGPFASPRRAPVAHGCTAYGLDAPAAGEDNSRVNLNMSNSASWLRDTRMAGPTAAEDKWRGGMASTSGGHEGRREEGGFGQESGHGAGAGTAHDRPALMPSHGGLAASRSETGRVPAGGAEVQEEVLPEGWKRYVSRTSGRPFYKNKATGATQWALPTREGV